MNYKKIYSAFIEKYKNQEFEKGQYTELHHILPRHAGGDDSKQNLIRLTYRQHTFAHRLLWKAFGNSCDLHAWWMMSGQEEDRVVAQRKARGLANVRSGHLDRIREKIDWDKVSRMTIEKNRIAAEKGLLQEYCKLMQAAWKGSHHTEEWKAERSRQGKVRMSDPEVYKTQMSYLRLAREARFKQSEKTSKDLIKNAERNEEYLQKTSSKSKNKFISPEGLEFDSPIYAAKYYGNIKPHVIENWCKRNQNGWSRKPKADKD